MKLEIEFMEAVHGVYKVIEYSRTDVCGTCKGTKGKPGSSP
jgi:DnaJ-class molecular chaperone